MKVHDRQPTSKSNNEKIAEIEKERDSIIENLSRYKQQEKINRDDVFDFIERLQRDVKGKFDRLNGFIRFNV